MKDTWGREVHVETQYYENKMWAAGKGMKSPRGSGLWSFHFGGYTYGAEISKDFEFTGTYSDAKRAAIKEAAKQGLNLVVVLI